MARRRYRARQNPSAGTWVAIGLGAVVLGAGVYFLAKSSAPAVNPATGQLVPTGDKLLTVSIPGQPGQGRVLLSTACQAARQLRGTPNGAVWANICQQNGGTV